MIKENKNIQIMLDNIIFKLAGDSYHDVGISYTDAEKMVKEAFNLGIQLSADNAEAYSRLIPFTEDEYESKVDKQSILKLKI